METDDAERSYPLRLEGRLDAPLSRWLWLVKWLLAIPHFVVLVFLWAAFVVMTIVAFFAILFTGRYPRSIFDFNVGVLRWTWRVAFYSHGVLGTDRYPPFTLEPVADYPATLEVAYPERLSRGLVLVKWLLAIPHYIVVAFFVGSAFMWWDDGIGYRGPGLIFVLVLIAAVVLLFTGRFPGGIYDFVLGLQRWAFRVGAYATLMTDAYPPFRLDTGGREPAAAAAAAEIEVPAARELLPRRWSAGRIAAVVAGSILALVSVGLLASGAALVVIDQTQRDSEGFLMSPNERFSTATYALVSDSVDVDVSTPDWVVDELLGTVRVRSESERPLFLGIAREQDAAGYLGGIARAVVTDIAPDPEYTLKPGGAPSTPPVTQSFWAASASGSGNQTLDWKAEDGSWVVVAMNEDGSRAVTAELRIGAELDALLWIGIVLLGFGVVVGLGAAGLVYLGARRPRSS